MGEGSQLPLRLGKDFPPNALYVWALFPTSRNPPRKSTAPLGRDVAEQFPLVLVDHALKLRGRCVDLLGRNVLVLQVTLKIRDIFGKRPLPLFVGWIDQARVYMAYVSRKDHALVNTRLYLPKEWANDRARRKAAGVPMVPRGAENGAERTASPALRVAPNCTDDADERNENGDRDVAVTPNVATTSRTQQEQAAADCIDPLRLDKKISPRGFEPLTFGSGGRSHDRATTKEDTELRDVSQGEVSTVVPSPPGAVSGPPFPPDLAHVINAWSRLPEAIKAGVLALVNAAKAHHD